MADGREDLAARAMRTALATAEALQRGDLGAVGRLRAELDDLRREAEPFPDLHAKLTVLAEAAGVVTASGRGEDPAVALRRFQQAGATLPDGDPLRAAAGESVSLVSAYLDGQAPAPERMAAIAAMADRPGLPAAERAYFHAIAGGLGCAPEADAALVDAGVEHLRTAARLAPESDSRRITYLIGLATALVRRTELSGDLTATDEAGQVLTEARRIAGGPQDPHWSQINEMLSHVVRRRPPAPDPRTPPPEPGSYALDALRGHAWQALMQPDPVAVRAAVRHAADDAVDLARRFLTDADPAGALRALDAGRGLALFAAAQSRDVAERLERAGRADLATRWRSAMAARPGTPPDDLRAEVWRTLSGTGAADPLDTPGLDEIQHALTVLDADALVYLIPGVGLLPGHAVIAPAAGAPSLLALPGLQIEDGLDVERYLSALSRRTLSAAEPEEDFAGSLGELCDWAWRAAIGPLYQSVLAGPGRPAGRPPRIVLAPMGELAWVPWQAARRSDDTYAIQLMAISHAASARMLCWSAGLRPVRPTPVGLIVGDPATGGGAGDLRSARMEAYAIRAAFYPGARYLGRRPAGTVSPSGAGTATEVRDWLTDPGPAAGAMAHLACHGVLQPDGSYLLLADGSRLPAETVVETMHRTPDREVGLVVLAACRTGRATTGYDEAYSLGTAFLAGGARSVLSTQWSIPDGSTSVLMFRFHRELARGRPVWAALREAQLWMLRPDREITDDMPAGLRDQLDHADPAAVVAWAGFVHGGQ